MFTVHDTILSLLRLLTFFTLFFFPFLLNPYRNISIVYVQFTITSDTFIKIFRLFYMLVTDLFFSLIPVILLHMWLYCLISSV